ncbi:MAG: hypothetical protein QM493_04130 [Sulfurovum sp.]
MKTIIINAIKQNSYKVELLEESKRNKLDNILIIKNLGDRHNKIMQISKEIKAKIKNIYIIYSGKFPSSHYVKIFRDEHCIDFIIREERGGTLDNLLNAIENRTNLSEVEGIVYRDKRQLLIT